MMISGVGNSSRAPALCSLIHKRHASGVKFYDALPGAVCAKLRYQGRFVYLASLHASDTWDDPGHIRFAAWLDSVSLMLNKIVGRSHNPKLIISIDANTRLHNGLLDMVGDMAYDLSEQASTIYRPNLLVICLRYISAEVREYFLQ